MLRATLLAVLALIAASVAVAGEAVVREQRSVTIDGAKEVWRLAWRGAPRDSRSCGPAEGDMATTCPCSGVAYAQVGDLVLERERSRRPPERQLLTPLFSRSGMVSNEQGPVAMLARWPMRLRDIDHSPTPTAIRARPAVPILRLRDYDHDGIAGEFLLQIDTLPCGKHLLVAVGVTRTDPRLHALTSAEHPERPLALYQWEWDALARTPKPDEVMDWPCDDHGATEESTMMLRADGGGLHATRITRSCPDAANTNGGSHHDIRLPRTVLTREIL